MAIIFLIFTARATVIGGAAGAVDF